MARIGMALAALLLAGCGGGKEPLDNGQANGAGTATAAVDRACASQETYDRLKELAFDEAARIRGGDAAELDRIADAAVVRMENPVVRERDAELNVTTCAGRMVLELPPGAQNAFDGQGRVSADVQYAAQTAADGSGLVYQLENAEPLIYQLATVGGVARADAGQPVTIPAPSGPPGAPRQVVPPTKTARATPPSPPTTAPAPAPAPEPTPAPRTRAAPTPAPPKAQPEPQRPATASARPSFSCRAARSRSEQMVCGSGALAALDRRMSSMFYSALAGAPPDTRAALRRSRDRFLAFRNRCGNEACIAQAYRDRMDEIADIAGQR